MKLLSRQRLRIFPHAVRHRQCSSRHRALNRIVGVAATARGLCSAALLGNRIVEDFLTRRLLCCPLVILLGSPWRFSQKCSSQECTINCFTIRLSKKLFLKVSSACLRSLAVQLEHHLMGCGTTRKLHKTFIDKLPPYMAHCLFSIFPSSAGHRPHKGQDDDWRHPDDELPAARRPTQLLPEHHQQPGHQRGRHRLHAQGVPEAGRRHVIALCYLRLQV